jgi:hypothetical protein
MLENVACIICIMHVPSPHIASLGPASTAEQTSFLPLSHVPPGDIKLTLLSVGARSGDRTYQSITTTMPVKDLKTCPASPCHSQAHQQQPAPGTLLMESAKAAPGTQFDPVQMAELEKQIMELDPKLVKDGSVNVQDLLVKLGLQQQALQNMQGVTAPAPEAAAAQPDAPKVFQIGDIFGPLKHLLPGQQQQNKPEGSNQIQINPLKFLQSVANLMPQQNGEGAAAENGQNPLKMLQNVAALVAAGSKDGGKEGSTAPIMNLLQTVGNVIQSSGNNATAQKDGLPILNMLQQLGGMMGQGGKDKEGNPAKGMDPAAMLDVVKSLGAMMPSENGGAPNVQNLMGFVNAVGKVLPGMGPSNEPAPKDLPSAGIAVLKSMAALLPKEAAAGQPTGPNWPAMLQFVKASGNLIQLMRPAAGAAGAAPHDE